MIGKKLDDGRTHAVGRRKTSVARVYIQRGKGEWRINGRSITDYFPRGAYQVLLDKPFQATETVGEYDVTVNVRGGGQRLRRLRSLLHGRVAPAAAREHTGQQDDRERMGRVEASHDGSRIENTSGRGELRS